MNERRLTADDPIFDTLLKRDSKCHPGRVNEPSQSPKLTTANEETPLPHPQQDVENMISALHVPVDGEDQPYAGKWPPFDTPNPPTNDWSIGELLGQEAEPSVDAMDDAVPPFNSTVENGILLCEDMATMDHRFHLEFNDHHSPLTAIYPAIPIAHPSDSLFGADGKLSPIQLCNAVETASVMYICQELDIAFDRSQIDGPESLLGFKAQYLDRIDIRTLHKLANVAAGLMSSYSGLLKYVATMVTILHGAEVLALIAQLRRRAVYFVLSFAGAFAQTKRPPLLYHTLSDQP